MGSTPLTFRCAKCKVGRDHRSLLNEDVRKGTRLDLTGKCRIGKVGRRYNVKQVQYKCRTCGHVGWSSHTSLTQKENT